MPVGAPHRDSLPLAALAPFLMPYRFVANLRKLTNATCRSVDPGAGEDGLRRQVSARYRSSKGFFYAHIVQGNVQPSAT